MVFLRQKTDADKYASVGADTNGIICRIDYDPSSVGVVKTSYAIRFLFDVQKKLRDVGVEQWLTGP